jgi:hypothetical protein
VIKIVLVGVFFSLLGYRVIGPKPGTNPRADNFYRLWGRSLRILGPIMIVGGILSEILIIASR